MAYPQKHDPERDKARIPIPGVALDLKLVENQLKRHRGNIYRTARSIGCARHTIQRLVNRHDHLRQVLEDERERVIDDVEDALLAKCLDEGDTTSIIFMLKTRGRQRGYQQDMQGTSEVLKSALDYVMNKTKNPAEF